VRRTLALGLLLLAATADQAWGLEAGMTTFGDGPGKAVVKAEWAVALKGAFEYKCDFSGSVKKAIVLYQLIDKDKAWKAIGTCHTQAGTSFGRIPESATKAQLAVTGWYGEGNAWKQCDLNGWRTNALGAYVTCAAPDGGSMWFTCAKSACRKP